MIHRRTTGAQKRVNDNSETTKENTKQKPVEPEKKPQRYFMRRIRRSQRD
jgi:hypothetical protein